MSSVWAAVVALAGAPMCWALLLCLTGLVVVDVLARRG